MGEDHPADFAAFRTLLPGMPFASDAEVARCVTERIVARRVEGVADKQFLGFRWCEFGRKRNRFVRSEHEIEPGILPDMLAPVGAVFGATSLEQRV